VVVGWVGVRLCSMDWPDGILAMSAEAIGVDCGVLGLESGSRCFIFLLSNHK
jgi:hypothetical protein